MLAIAESTEADQPTSRRAGQRETVSVLCSALLISPATPRCVLPRRNPGAHSIKEPHRETCCPMPAESAPSRKRSRGNSGRTDDGCATKKQRPDSQAVVASPLLSVVGVQVRGGGAVGLNRGARGAGR